ncbi:leucine-rich repeat-containing protein 27-like isoform X3 [Lepisosteus oculatus]|uniref:leucine-rich repeat-containing protein 27-like isoform X3 n=1 Tax=Lepisosteus oculatus TaxID=7918 RepID=UPI0035F50987
MDFEIHLRKCLDYGNIISRTEVAGEQVGRLSKEIQFQRDYEEKILDLSKRSLMKLNYKNISRNIEQLYLQGNILEELPTRFFEWLPRLFWLDVRNNQLERLPAEVGQHRHMHTLLLENNPLRELPVELGNVRTLKALGLRDCPLHFPPVAVLSLGTESILSFLRRAAVNASTGLEPKTRHSNITYIEKEMRLGCQPSEWFVDQRNLETIKPGGTVPFLDFTAAASLKKPLRFSQYRALRKQKQRKCETLQSSSQAHSSWQEGGSCQPCPQGWAAVPPASAAEPETKERYSKPDEKKTEEKFSAVFKELTEKQLQMEKRKIDQDAIQKLSVLLQKKKENISKPGYDVHPRQVTETNENKDESKIQNHEVQYVANKYHLGNKEAGNCQQIKIPRELKMLRTTLGLFTSATPSPCTSAPWTRPPVFSPVFLHDVSLVFPHSVGLCRPHRVRKELFVTACPGLKK